MSFSSDPDTNLSKRVWELWTMLHLNYFSNNVAEQDSDKNYNNTFLDTSFGVERFFSKIGIFKDFSLYGLIHIERKSLNIIEDPHLLSTVTELGGGFNLYFANASKFSNTLIPFFTGGMAFGQGKDTHTPNSGTQESFKSTTTSFFTGFGIKCFNNKGWGLRALIDYYHRNERFSFSDNSRSNIEKTVSGLRFLAGFSYRY